MKSIFIVCVYFMLSPVEAQGPEISLDHQISPPLGVELDKVTACTDANMNGLGIHCLLLHKDEAGLSDMALIKDIKGQTQFLVVATHKRRELGLYEVGEPPLFTGAWNARVCALDIAHEIDPTSSTKISDFAITLNSRYHGSMDRQHVHVDLITEPAKSDLMKVMPGATSAQIAGQVYELHFLTAIDDTAIFNWLNANPPAVSRTAAIVDHPSLGLMVMVRSDDPNTQGAAEYDFQNSATHERRLKEREAASLRHCRNFDASKFAPGAR